MGTLSILMKEYRTNRNNVLNKLDPDKLNQEDGKVSIELTVEECAVIYTLLDIDRKKDY